MQELCKKHALDADATQKLTSIMARREMVQGCDVETDLRELDQHLGASRKPSALVSESARAYRS